MRVGPHDRCSALDDNDRCAIYPYRPLVCRSHGVPIKTVSNTGAGPVSPVVQVCELNFSSASGLEDVEEDCVLDQTTLSTILAALDSALCDAYDLPRGLRTPWRKSCSRRPIPGEAGNAQAKRDCKTPVGSPGSPKSLR